AEDGIRDRNVTGVQTCALPIFAGQRLRFSDSFVAHEWDITPGVSLMVDCESAEDLERLFTALSVQGTVYMPLDDYGFGPFGWVRSEERRVGKEGRAGRRWSCRR